MRIVIFAIISLNEFGTRVTKRARTMHYSSWMFHRKFILSITITRFKLSNPLFMLIRFFLFARNFVWRHENFINPLINLCPFPVRFTLHSFMQARFQRDISARRNTYRDLAVGNDSSPLLNNAPRATATTSFCNKSESHGVLVGEEYVFVGWDATIDSRVIEWNRLWIITEIATLVTWDSSKRFCSSKNVCSSSVGMKSYFYFERYVFRDSSFARVCVYTRSS